MAELSGGPRVLVGVKHTRLHPVPQLHHGGGQLQYFGVSSADRRAVGLGMSLGGSMGAMVTIVSVGPPSARETLKELLTIGVNEAVLFEHPPDQSPTLDGVVRSIGLAASDLDAHIIVVGDYSGDEGSGAVGRSLAVLLPSMQYVPRVTALSRHGEAFEVQFELDIRTMGQATITNRAIMTTSNTPFDLPNPNLSRRASISSDPAVITTLPYSESLTQSTTLAPRSAPRIPPKVPEGPQGKGDLHRLRSILGGTNGISRTNQLDQHASKETMASTSNSGSCAEEILRLLTRWGVISTA